MRMLLLLDDGSIWKSELECVRLNECPQDHPHRLLMTALKILRY